MRRDRRDSVSESDEQRPIKQSFFGSLRRDTHWKCLIISLLINSCLAAIGWCRFAVTDDAIDDIPPDTVKATHVERESLHSPCNDGYIYIPVAFVIMLYLVYLVECWHCHTRIELQHKVDVSNVYERVQVMRESMPIIWWKAICYHYVRRTRQVTRYRNGDAFTTTQVYYERINTYTAGSAFNFTMCGLKDLSKYLVGLEVYPATKIKFSKGFSFINWASENEFERQRGHFFRDNERRDDYMETREGMDLLNVNFKEYLIAFADADNQPWYVSHAIFWVVSLLLLSWPLRVFIEYKTAYVHYHVHKQFGGNYDSNNHITTTVTRPVATDYTDIEMAIFNNYAIVPSYSEAVLLTNGIVIPDTNANIFHPPVRQPRSVSFNNFVLVNKQSLANRTAGTLSNQTLANIDQSSYYTSSNSITDTRNASYRDTYLRDSHTYLRDSHTHDAESGSIINFARKSKRKKTKWRKFMSTPDFRSILSQSNSVTSFQNPTPTFHDATTVRTNRYRRNSVTDEYENVPLHERTFMERLRQIPSSFSWTSTSPYDEPPAYEDAVRMRRLNSISSRLTVEERAPLYDSLSSVVDVVQANYNAQGFMETSL